MTNTLFKIIYLYIIILNELIIRILSCAQPLRYVIVVGIVSAGKTFIFRVGRRKCPNRDPCTVSSRKPEL